MDSGSDDSRVSNTSEAAGGCGEEEYVKVIDLSHMGEDAPREGEIDEAGCFTEAWIKRVCPPIPDWMRKPPKLKSKQPTLFDDDE